MDDSQKQQLKEQYIAARGYWAPFWDYLLEWDPSFFEIYAEFSMAPWKSARLDPKTKECIYIAIDAAATHMYEPGLRIHIQRALELGVTRDEIVEVLELVSVLGIHACTMGLPVLAEELEKFQSAGEGGDSANGDS